MIAPSFWIDPAGEETLRRAENGIHFDGAHSPVAGRDSPAQKTRPAIVVLHLHES